MSRIARRPSLALIAYVAAALTGLVFSPPNASAQKFEIKSVAEKTVQHLPPGPLFWRIENFPTLAQAQAAAGSTGLAAEVDGKVWLFTLGAKGGSSPGGSRVAEIGPLPPVAAPEYLLRINRTGGPPGVETPVHTHPGSETFYVLSGQLTQKSPHGLSRVDAGQTMAGHGPGMPMQVSSSGTADLKALVMFFVDATKPFSSPATFANSTNSQLSLPKSEQADRIKMLVDRAAQLVNAKGKEAFSEFRKRGSEWFSGDTYIFAYAPDGTVVLNPAFPAREGRAYHGELDKKGKAFHDEIMKTAQAKGSGWVDYWLPKPGQTEPSQKWSYVKAVKAEGVAVIGAGYFPN